MQNIILSDTQKAQLIELSRLMGEDPNWILESLITSLFESQGLESDPSKFDRNQTAD
jgi:hypothetical protein